MRMLETALSHMLWMSSQEISIDYVFGTSPQNQLQLVPLLYVCFFMEEHGLRYRYGICRLASRQGMEVHCSELVRWICWCLKELLRMQ